MQSSPSKAQIIDAIVNQRYQFLRAPSQQRGYCTILLSAISDQNLDMPSKGQVLQELKKQIKMRWISRTQQMCLQQKQHLRSIIIECFINTLPSTYQVTKTFKEIITLILGNQFRVWSPSTIILEKIALGYNLPQCIHALLAVANSFQYSITQEERSEFYSIIQRTLPVLINLLNQRDDSQITYLCIKFLWKAVHYQISPTIKALTLEWMPIVQTIVGSTHSLYDDHINQVQERQSQAFFYFHSKKWATRILLRFIQKHAKKISFNRNQDNRQFSEKWYGEHGNRIISVLVKQFTVSTTKKVRYFQLKCISALIDQNKQKMKQYSDYFQYEVLFNYLRLSPQDEELALKQPIAFMRKQNQPIQKFSQIKLVVRDVWVKFSEIGFQAAKKGEQCKPAPRLSENIQFIKDALQKADQNQTEVSLHLLILLAKQISKCQVTHQSVKELLLKYLLPNCNNQNIFIRSRALEVYKQFSFIKFEEKILKEIFSSIYLNLNDQYDIVRLNAFSALSKIIINKSFSVQPANYINQMMDICLQLIERYGQQEIMNDFQNIICQFGDYVSSSALAIIERLSKIFFKMAEKDHQEQKKRQYDGQFSLVAAKCLKTITKIIQIPLQSSIIPKIESFVAQILQFAFFTENAQNYMNEVLILLKIYLFKVPQLSQKIWFYYPYIIFLTIGLNRSYPDKFLAKFRLNSRPTFFLVQNLDYLEYAYPVLRNYMQKVSQGTHLRRYEHYKAQLITFIIHLTNHIYNKKLNEQNENLSVIICTSLMATLIQNFKNSLPNSLYIQMWEFSRINLIKYRSQRQRAANSMLIGLLLWGSPLNILIVAQRQNMMDRLVTQITQSNYGLDYQRSRMILGLNQLLLLQQKPKMILPKMPDLFKTHLKLIEKNIQSRSSIQSAPQAQEGDLENQFLGNQDEYLWDEQYEQHYSSPLVKIDQIWEFQHIVEKIKIEQADFYRHLISAVPVGQVDLVRQQISTIKIKCQ